MVPRCWRVSWRMQDIDVVWEWQQNAERLSQNAFIRWIKCAYLSVAPLRRLIPLLSEMRETIDISIFRRRSVSILWWQLFAYTERMALLPLFKLQRIGESGKSSRKIVSKRYASRNHQAYILFDSGGKRNSDGMTASMTGPSSRSNSTANHNSQVSALHKLINE